MPNEKQDAHEWASCFCSLESYRRVPEIRRLHAFSDVTRWVDHYGLWERQWDQSKPSEGGYGASTNIRRWNLRQRKLPGSAPAVIRYLLSIIPATRGVRYRTAQFYAINHAT